MTVRRKLHQVTFLAAGLYIWRKGTRTAVGEKSVVTGAFSYTGRYIAKELLSRGKEVATLTRHADTENVFDGRINALPFDFGHPDDLVRSLSGVTSLYNTYWVRFPYGRMTFEQAVKNTKVLVEAAREAGVQRIIHISITNPSEDSPLGYFRGKALAEKAVIESRLSYAIVRPTLIFGKEDLLLNNIAWFLRTFPLFPVFGSGNYRVQPVFVEDVAELAVDAGHREENLVMDAVGPETFRFDELVKLIAEKIGSCSRAIHLPTHLAFFLTRCAGLLIKDVVLTWEEIRGLKSNLLVSSGPATVPTRFTDWLGRNASRLGSTYTSELRRNFLKG